MAFLFEESSQCFQVLRRWINEIFSRAVKDLLWFKVTRKENKVIFPHHLIVAGILFLNKARNGQISVNNVDFVLFSKGL